MDSAARKLDNVPETENSKEQFGPIQTDWEYYSAKDLDKVIRGSVDSIGLISGVANTIMQLAYPGVGHGVMESPVESGSILHHPIKRARTTLAYLSVAMFGTREEKLAYRSAINKAHALVNSTENSPVQYRALDPKLQLWVAACLFWGLLDVHQKLHGPMDKETQEKLYQLSKPLGTTLQVRDSMWPEDIDGFWVYWNETLESIEIPEDVRVWLMQLVNLDFLHPVVKLVFGNSARMVTAGFLHPKIREQMRLRWTPKHERRFNRLIKMVSVLNNPMPRFIRQLPGLILMWDFRRRMKNGLPLR